MEQPDLLKAFQVGRPDAKLPNRKDLGGKLLDETYSECGGGVARSLNDKCAVALVTDAFTNVNGACVHNYMAMHPDTTLFLKTVNTGTSGHTAPYLRDDLLRVAAKLPCDWVGAVTDNTATNKLMWKQLERQFPTKFFNGCSPHALALLVKDIFSPTVVPEGYPFDELNEFIPKLNDLTKFVPNSP